MTKLVTDDLLADLNIAHERNVPLGPKTWYGVGGPAEVLATPASIAQLGELAVRCHEANVPLRVLGSGANLLVSDEGVPGVVVQLSEPAFTNVEREGTMLRVGAGADLFKLVLDSTREGLAGLETVAGIPASVGGAVRMNAGGAYGDIGSSVSRVQVMSGNGQVYYRDRADLVFSYRKTNIVAPLILQVEFALEEDDPETLMKRVKEIFFYKKNSQPMGAASAGCAFKNPPAEAADGAGAGKLIDQAGLKGYRHGRAHVSEVHANFIAADEGATAADVLAVISHVQQTVRERFDVELEREVVVWP
ncbi:UDP-N-acetylmuramate dehydrogenase [Phycisphaerales bacterium AB-hyl4]|uniref:UDP-N-acetylenolpyruvoylglucosamine reductase n=1 Tax=Natronomicrosphaera hydrolytica TaxID=3242702 RepID=A0ABV4U7W4_9BACT